MIDCIVNAVILLATGQFNAPMCGVYEDSAWLQPVYYAHQTMLFGHSIAYIGMVLGLLIVGMLLMTWAYVNKE